MTGAGPVPFSVRPAGPAAPFVPGRLTRSWTQHLDAPPDVVFPLLGPAGERTWAGKEWDPVFLHPRPERDVEGCVFETVAGDGARTVWHLLVFDAASRRVLYSQVTPGVKVTRLEVVLAPEGTGRTAARVTYTWTALSEKGNVFIDHHRTDHFDRAMSRWEQQLNAYLASRNQTGVPG